VIRVLRADERYVARQPGIVTWSCFASGSHYEPDNVAFGSLVAVDEHELDPGAGFAMHPHRGVDLITYVLSGTLMHEDEDGARSLVAAGELQLQHTGGGARHAETNPSDREKLRMIQLAVLSEDDRSDRAPATLPVVLASGRLNAVTAAAELTTARHHLHVLDGRFVVSTTGTELHAGDSVRADVDLALTGTGLALVWTPT
jgi:quercetin 2,3-dioxygenase